MTNRLFDSAFYLRNNADVKAAGVDAETHYNTFGWKEGRSASAFFDTSYYQAGNPDVMAANINPLDHYFAFGGAEGRNPGANFNDAFYLNQNPDVVANGINPLLHFLLFGASEGRLPYPSFSETAYTAANADVAAAIQAGTVTSGLAHFAQWGVSEGRSGVGTPSMSSADVVAAALAAVAAQAAAIAEAAAAAADHVAPAMTSAAVAADGRSIVITYSENLTGTAEAADYAVTPASGMTSVTSATLGTGGNANKVTLTLSSPIIVGTTATIAYTGGNGTANSIKDTATNPVNSAITQTLVSGSVANNSTAPAVTLTTATDTPVGTGGNDTYLGTYGDGAGPYTFNLLDVLDGAGGTADTLTITTGAEASTPPDALWANKSNIEKLAFNSIGNGAQSITTGANFQAAFAGGVDLSVKTLLGAINLTMTTFTGPATITTTTIGNGAHTITTGSGVTTVDATALAAGAQTIKGAGLTTVNATVYGAGSQVIGDAIGGGANLVTVNATVVGAGDQTITSTSASAVTVVATAAAGAQTIVTGIGNDNVTARGAAGQADTITTNAGNDIIVAGLSTDLITAGLGADTMTGGGATDTFAFSTDGSVIGTSMDIITDFNTAGADILVFGAATNVLSVDGTALVAGSGGGANVQQSAGGLITFAVADNTLALKIAALQADLQLDAVNAVAMFVDSGNTYLYYAGALVGNADDQLVQLTGLTTLITITGGATTTIV